MNIPGVQGLSGPGAYTITAGNPGGFSTIPAANGSVTINVVTSVWMAVGMTVLIGQGPGPALAQAGPVILVVTAIPSVTSFTGLVILGGVQVSDGAVVTPNGPISQSYGVVASGTGYTFSQVSFVEQAVTFSVTSPVVTLPMSGTYLLLCRLKINLAPTSTTTGQSVNLGLRRINNVPTDLATTWTNMIFHPDNNVGNEITAFDGALPFILYTTLTANDTIQVYGYLSAAIGNTGTCICKEATLVAVRLN